MTLRIEVEDGAARWSDIVAEVEAGRDVVIARGGVSVATVKGELPPRVTSREAIDAILELRKRMPRATAEEILEWRDEGRR